MLYKPLNVFHQNTLSKTSEGMITRTITITSGFSVKRD